MRVSLESFSRTAVWLGTNQAMQTDVNTGGKEYIFRLYFIDAPETDMPVGKSNRLRLKKFVRGSWVTPSDPISTAKCARRLPLPERYPKR